MEEVAVASELSLSMWIVVPNKVGKMTPRVCQPPQHLDAWEMQGRFAHTYIRGQFFSQQFLYFHLCDCKFAVESYGKGILHFCHDMDSFLFFSSFIFPFLLLNKMFGHRRVGNRANGVKLRGTQPTRQNCKQERQTEQIVRVISIVNPLIVIIEAKSPQFSLNA